MKNIQDKSIVSIVKCNEYNLLSIISSLKRIFDLLGGFSQYVKFGNKILIKPNLLTDAPPHRAVTTHPTIIAGLIELIRDYGGIPYIGDSPALKSFEKVIKKTGLLPIIKKYNVKILHFKEKKERYNPKNKIFKKIPLAKELWEIDKIFNVPKLKTHILTYFTGAIKNMYGCIPGIIKSEFHFKVRNTILFSHLILDIYDTVSPDLTIMDGIIGMEGKGPGNGNPRHIGVILGSKDGLALDTIALKLIGQNPYKVPFISLGEERKIGNTLLENIVIKGEDLNNFHINNFQVPIIKPDLMSISLPQSISHWIQKNIGYMPKINNKKCIKCERCIKNCPANTIYKLSSQKNEKEIYIFEDNCIKCYCCIEICPNNAISLYPKCLTPLFEFIKKYISL